MPKLTYGIPNYPKFAPIKTPTNKRDYESTLQKIDTEFIYIYNELLHIYDILDNQLNRIKSIEVKLNNQLPYIINNIDSVNAKLLNKRF